MADAVETNKTAPKQAHEWPGAFTVLNQAYVQIAKNPEPAFVYAGVYLFLWIISTLTLPSSTKFGYESLTPLFFLLALPTYGLAIADKKHITIREFLRFDIVTYLYVLGATVLGALIAGLSALLLIVPIIWTVAWFYAASFSAVDKHLNPIKALKYSKHLAENHKSIVWAMIGVSFLVSIGGGIVSLIPIAGTIALALISVLINAAGAILYRWLQAQPHPEHTK